MPAALDPDESEGIESSGPLDDSIIRGVKIDLLLSNAACVFQSNEMSYATWSLSRPMHGSDIDDFISHTWRSSGGLKRLALLYEYSGSKAYWSAHGAAVAALVVQICLRLSGFELPCSVHFAIPRLGLGRGPADHGAIYPHFSGICFLAGSIAGLLSLFAGHNFGRSKSAFVDKVCINQVDEELKQQGVLAIGQFLTRSHRLLILWDDDYFERLWCNFEMAAFSFQKGTEDSSITFVPMMLPVFAVAICILFVIGWPACALIMRVIEFEALLDFSNIWHHYMFCTLLYSPVFWIPKMLILLHLNQSRVLIDHQLERFSVRSAKCFSQYDRQVVESSISTMFGSIEQFDKMVRGEFRRFGQNVSGLRGVVDRQWGDSLPLWAVLFENWPVCIGLLYDGIALSNDFRSLAVTVLLSLLQHLVWNPLFVFWANAVARRAVATTCAGWLRVTLCSIIAPVLGLWFPTLMLVVYNLPLWVNMIHMGVGVVAVYFVYNRPSWHPIDKFLPREAGAEQGRTRKSRHVKIMRAISSDKLGDIELSM